MGRNAAFGHTWAYVGNGIRIYPIKKVGRRKYYKVARVAIEKSMAQYYKKAETVLAQRRNKENKSSNKVNIASQEGVRCRREGGRERGESRCKRGQERQRSFGKQEIYA